MRRRLVVAVMALVMTMGGGAGYIGPAVVHASGGGGGNGGVTPFGCSGIREATGSIYDPSFPTQKDGEVRIYKDSCSGNIHATVVVCCAISGTHCLTVNLYQNGTNVAGGVGCGLSQDTGEVADCSCSFSATGEIDNVNVFGQNATGSVSWHGP